MNDIIEIIAGDININNKERIISMAGGIALAVLGILSIKKKPATAWSEVAAGAALIIRGATGHCPVNAALNKNTAATELVEEAEAEFELFAD
jgi:uncharacterized membrane protein